MLELSSDQSIALDNLLSWYKSRNKKQYITLGGYAGTGKTTLISLFRKKLDKDNKKARVAFCSYTGKASRVLKNKLEESESEYPLDFTGTIHSLIYSPIENEKQEIVGWELRDTVDYDLIIVDEASMVDNDIWDDLTSFSTPIIAVGDHGQLPPIKGRFNLIENPELKLEQIHRQARDNPIIKISVLARERGFIPVGDYGQGISKFLRRDEDAGEKIASMLHSYDENTLVLCGYNYSRVKLNNYIRHAKEFESPFPEVNDRVICLRNNRAQEIFNGMLGKIQLIEREDDDWYYAEVQMDDKNELYKGLISLKQFGNPESMNFTDKRAYIKNGDLFDFGYALTVHKAQGSQSGRVILFEERFSKMNDDMWKRWLYTAVTRAERELYIVG